MDICRDVGFVHLHVHTSYSLREGALTIAKLAKLAIADNTQPALAITDTNNLFGALEFSEKLAKEGVQPIVGVQLGVDFGDRPAPTSGLELPVAGAGGLVLIARNETGYEQLMRLVSRAWLDSDAMGEPHAAIAALADNSSGLIALTGGPAGPIDSLIREGQLDLARARIERLKDIFGDRLYVELQRHNEETEREAKRYLRDIAYRGALPLVATNEPYFAARSDFEAHDALLCISDGVSLGDDARRRLNARTPLQDPRRNARPVRRPAGGDRQFRRHRAALLLPADDAQADPAALHHRRHGGRRRGSLRGERAAPAGGGGASRAPCGPCARA